MKSTEIINELIKLEKEIDKAKEDKARLEGRLSELLKTLKEQFNYNNIEEAEGGLIKLTEKLTELEKELEDKFNALKKEYQWEI